MLNRDPRLIQFFKSTQFTRDQAGAPIRSTETKNIEEMIFIPQNSRDTRRIRKKIFYQVRQQSISAAVKMPPRNIRLLIKLKMFLAGIYRYFRLENLFLEY